jgi:hypothetical protein
MPRKKSPLPLNPCFSLFSNTPIFDKIREEQDDLGLNGRGLFVQ